MTTPADPSIRRVTLLTKPGCHLCDDARPLLVEALTPMGLAFDEVDITTDAALYATYWTQIPVVLVDGEVIGVHHVDPTALATALATPPAGSESSLP